MWLQHDGLTELANATETRLHNAPQILLIEKPGLFDPGLYLFLERYAWKLIDDIDFVGAGTEVGFDSSFYLDQIQKILLSLTVLLISVFVECLPVLLLIHKADLLQQEHLFSRFVLQDGSLLALVFNRV